MYKLSIHAGRAMRAAASAVACVAFAAAATTLATAYQETPPGGKYKECHGYVIEAAEKTLKVHCLDGTPVDLSFDLPITQDVLHADGSITQVKELKKGDAVHVLFGQSLGTRKAYKIYFADPNATGTYGLKT
jgi:hypothetical protein